MSTANQALQRANLIKEIALNQAISRKLCFDSLYHFTKEFWPIIEPGTPFVDGWHIRVICSQLERASRFEVKRLIINMPPRHMKSILINVMFPAWIWLRNPERRFITASYSQTLSLRDAVKMRLIVGCEKYQALTKGEWSLRDDQNVKSKFENTQSGFRFSTSVGGTVTGEGGDFLIVDDPNNALEVNSEKSREECKFWYDTVFSSRFNDAEKHCKIIVQQRLHEDDLSGHLFKNGKDYERLILQARFEPTSKVKSATVLEFKDPRKVEGEPLWPERFKPEHLDQLEHDLNATGLGSGVAQLQQDPKPKSGGLFKRHWWQLYDVSPSPILETAMFVDGAQKPGITNDYSVIAIWARTAKGYYLIDLWKDKVEAPKLEAMVLAKYNQFKPNAVVIEDKSSGSSLIQYLRFQTTLPVIAFDPGQNDKEVRATAATPTAEAGKLHLPKGADWVEDFITEHEKFPKGKHDDQVDTTSMMVEHFSKRSSVGPRIRSA